MNTKKLTDFNIYYLNFAKVYKMAMMINNVILTKIEKDQSKSFEEQYGYTSSISDQGTKKFLDGIKASISSDVKETTFSFVDQPDKGNRSCILIGQIGRYSYLSYDYL